MKLAIHFPDHKWKSAILGEEIEINHCYCDLLSGPVWINDEWGNKYDIFFGAGHTHQQWDDVVFGSENDPEQELDKFFGQEVPIYMSGYIADDHPNTDLECGDQIPGFESLNKSEFGIIFQTTITYFSEDDFWAQVRPLVEKYLLEIKNKENL